MDILFENSLHTAVCATRCRTRACAAPRNTTAHYIRARSCLLRDYRCTTAYRLPAHALPLLHYMLTPHSASTYTRTCRAA